MIRFFDSTLRDGSHAISHQLTSQQIQDYCQAVDTAGIEVVVVGHGNGLGASSLQVGLSALSDEEMLTMAKKQLLHTKLGAFLIPGFGTITDHLQGAIQLGVQVVCVAAHCTEADVTRQHIEYVRACGKEAYGVLMMYHRADPRRLVIEAKKMQDYGAFGVILMDSAGASLPATVQAAVEHLREELKIPIGFHGHNNLSMAVANTYTALLAGASIVDGTIRGFGAGAGNCQLEVLAAFLEKMELATPVNLYQLMDVSEEIVRLMMKKPQEINDISLISGMAGVFSSFAPHVKKAALEFQVDPRDIFLELGKRGVVGGQEDCIVDVAMNLSQETKKNQISYQLEALL